MKLSTKQLGTLAEVLRIFERATEKETAVHYISGGFAEAEMFDYDEEYIDIELKWGIQSDCENTVHTEQWKLPTEVLDKPIEHHEMVALIKTA